MRCYNRPNSVTLVLGLSVMAFGVARSEELTAPNIQIPEPEPGLVEAPSGDDAKAQPAAEAKTPPILWVRLTLLPDQFLGRHSIMLENGERLTFAGRQLTTTEYVLNTGVLQYRLDSDVAGYPRVFAWDPTQAAAVSDQPNWGTVQVPVNLQQTLDVWPETTALVLDPTQNQIVPFRGDATGFRRLPLARTIELRVFAPDQASAAGTVIMPVGGVSRQLVGNQPVSLGPVANSGRLAYQLLGDRPGEYRYLTWIADYFPPTAVDDPAPVLQLPISLSDFPARREPLLVLNRR